MTSEELLAIIAQKDEDIARLSTVAQIQRDILQQLVFALQHIARQSSDLEPSIQTTLTKVEAIMAQFEQGQA